MYALSITKMQKILKTLFVLTLIFAGSNHANAAIKYFDANFGDGGDGSYTSPYNQFSDATVTAGDFFICKGTFNEQVTLTNVANISIYPWNGFDCVLDGQNTYDYGISADRTTGLNVGNIEIKNYTRNGIKVFTGTAATTISSVVISGTKIHDIGPGTTLPFSEYEVEKGTCLFMRTNTSSTAIIDGVSILDVDAYNCGKHGIDFRFQVRNVTIDRAKVWETGLTATGHGISIHPWKETATGWTLVSGNVYTKNRFSVNDQEQRMVDQTNRRVFAWAASSTNPGVYEWGTTTAGVGACSTAASTGCVYANIGGPDPDTVTMSEKRFKHGPFLIKNSIAHDIDSGVDTAEGHGFDADDLSGPATFLNNLSYDNYGNGMMSFFGENVSFIGNVVMNNGGSGIYSYLCTSCSAYNNTIHSNNDLGFYDGGTENAGLKLKNNIFTNNTTRSAGLTSSTTNSSGFSAANNIAWNNVTNNACNGFTCTQADPHYVGGSDPTTVAGLKVANSTYGSSGSEVPGGVVYYDKSHSNSEVTVGAYRYGYRSFRNRN